MCKECRLTATRAIAIEAVAWIETKHPDAWMRLLNFQVGPGTARRRLRIGVIVVIIVHNCRIILSGKVRAPGAAPSRKRTFIRHDRDRRPVVRIRAVREMCACNGRMRREMHPISIEHAVRGDYRRCSRGRNRRALENGSRLGRIHDTVWHDRD